MVRHGEWVTELAATEERWLALAARAEELEFMRRHGAVNELTPQGDDKYVLHFLSQSVALVPVAVRRRSAAQRTAAVSLDQKIQ